MRSAHKEAGFLLFDMSSNPPCTHPSSGGKQQPRTLMPPLNWWKPRALRGALASMKARSTSSTVGSEQRGAVRVSARDEHGGNAADVCRQARGHQAAQELAGGDEHLRREHHLGFTSKN